MRDDPQVTALGRDPEPTSEPPPSRFGHAHGLSVMVMAISALVGTVGLFLFATVGWTGMSRRTVIVSIVLSVVAFVAAAAIAILSAARDTYATTKNLDPPGN